MLDSETRSLGIPIATREIADRYHVVRRTTESICEPLEPEDCCIQSMPEASPTKWHLAHTSWFFETFLLKPSLPGYQSPNAKYEYLFNSYYNTIGQQYSRPDRGNLSRPTLAEVMDYREQVDQAISELLSGDSCSYELLALVELGIQHEQQHQELMLMDIKHVFSCNPLKPVYRDQPVAEYSNAAAINWIDFEGSLQKIGHDGSGFAFDNERPRHRVFVESFQLADRLSTCGEFLEFINDGGYERSELWLSDGWRVAQQQRWNAPLYWEQNGTSWRIMTLGGMRDLNPAEPVCHVSFYEADAFARWKRCWLPRETAWEMVACQLPIEGNFLDLERLHPSAAVSSSDSTLPLQMFGDVWEWTSSPYSAYPGYRANEGALGEYNGKFMCNQLILRGGSCVTPLSHIRPTYRNFFPPEARWPFTGIRLAKEV